MQQKYYNSNSKCRLWHLIEDTIDHISACPVLAKEQYIDSW